jgi:hypothetical protein
MNRYSSYNNFRFNCSNDQLAHHISELEKYELMTVDAITNLVPIVEYGDEDILRNTIISDPIYIFIMICIADTDETVRKYMKEIGYDIPLSEWDKDVITCK